MSLNISFDQSMKTLRTKLKKLDYAPDLLPFIRARRIADGQIDFLFEWGGQDSHQAWVTEKDVLSYIKDWVQTYAPKTKNFGTPTNTVVHRLLSEPFDPEYESDGESVRSSTDDMHETDSISSSEGSFDINRNHIKLYSLDFSTPSTVDGNTEKNAAPTIFNSMDSKDSEQVGILILFCCFIQNCLRIFIDGYNIRSISRILHFQYHHISNFLCEDRSKSTLNMPMEQ